MNVPVSPPASGSPEATTRRRRTSPAALVLIAPIRFYQRFITPYTPATCRYYPTCSAYAVTALRRRGALVGSVLTGWRLLRCNPWSDGGIDHVPHRGWPRRGGEPRADEHGSTDQHTHGATHGRRSASDDAGSGHPVDYKSDSTELTRTATAGSQNTGRPAA